MSGVRALWAEVIERRRAWHIEANAIEDTASMENWHPHDAAWRGILRDTTEIACESTTGGNQVDPREALLDVLAVASAWIDRMERLPPTVPGVPTVIDPEAIGKPGPGPVVQLPPGAAALIRLPPRR